MADGGKLANTLGTALVDVVDGWSLQPVGATSGTTLDGTDGGLLHLACSNEFMVSVAGDNPTLSTSCTQIAFSHTTTPEYAVADLMNTLGTGAAIGGESFGTSGAPSLYKMRAYQTGAGVFEYWTSSGAPQLTNPSGLPIAAGSLSVVAMKRPTQHVVH